MLSLLIALIIGVLVVWVIRTLLPLLGLPEPILTVINVVIVVFVVIWLLSLVFGVSSLPHFSGRLGS